MSFSALHLPNRFNSWESGLPRQTSIPYPSLPAAHTFTRLKIANSITCTCFPAYLLSLSSFSSQKQKHARETAPALSLTLLLVKKNISNLFQVFLDRKATLSPKTRRPELLARKPLRGWRMYDKYARGRGTRKKFNIILLHVQPHGISDPIPRTVSVWLALRHEPLRFFWPTYFGTLALSPPASHEMQRNHSEVTIYIVTPETYQYIYICIHTRAYIYLSLSIPLLPRSHLWVHAHRSPHMLVVQNEIAIMEISA